MDGQHLSAKGHNLVPEQAFAAVAPSLSFLRIRSEPYASNSTSKLH
jgi:hypothetical protein